MPSSSGVIPVAALSADERTRRVLAVVPEILRADRPASAALTRVTELARSVFDAERAGATLLEDDGSLGTMTFADIPQQGGADRPSRGGRALFAALAHGSGVRRVDNPDQDPRLGGSTRGMRSLLVVPLTAGQRTIGMLYVADRHDGRPFSADDEVLAAALGATVGSAVANAALLRDALRARAWMRAGNAMTRDLLSENVDQPLRLISDRARELAEADVVLMLLREDQEMRVRYARGLGAERRIAGNTFPLSGNRIGRVLDSGRSLMIPDLNESREPAELCETSTPLGPAMLVPLHGAHEVLGVLFLARVRGNARFTQADLETAGTFADHAAVSLELASAREVAEKLRLLEERNRIARDLHDHVIQRLYATGMALQQVLSKVDDDTRTRIEIGIATLDDTIRQIRNTIMTLRSPEEPGSTFGTLVTTIVREAEPLLGFAPVLDLDPSVSETTGQLASDLAACVREGLSNILRHARAEAVELHGSVFDSELRLVLKDDGIGIRSTRRSGLDNLSKRIQQHGGTLDITSPAEGGAQLTWRVPRPRAQR